MFLFGNFALAFSLLLCASLFTERFLAGIYSPNAYRGFAREFIKDLESIRFVTTLFIF